MSEKTKVVVIGVGNVGSDIGFGIINQGLCNELVMVDINQEKVEGEVLDLQHANVFMDRKIRIKAGEYQDCGDADVVIITASAPMDSSADNRLDMLNTSKRIMDSIVPNIMRCGFHGILLVVSNPVDIMTYYAWKLSNLPAERVIGSGTVLDTARLTHILSEVFDINSKSIDINVIGEHGDSESIVWSNAVIGGKSLERVMHDNSDRAQSVTCDTMKKDTIAAGWKIFQRKGNTSYGIAASVTCILKSILFDEDRIQPVSVYLDGIYGLRDVYLSLPAVINKSGVREIVELDLNDKELEELKESYDVLRKYVALL